MGPIIGGITLMDMDFSSYFILTGMFLFAPLIVIYASTNNRKNSSTRLNNSSLTDASNHYRSLAKNKNLVTATIIGSLNTAFFIAFTTFTTVLVIRNLGLSPEIAAMLISLKGGATILAVFFCGTIFLAFIPLFLVLAIHIMRDGKAESNRKILPL